MSGPAFVFTVLLSVSPINWVAGQIVRCGTSPAPNYGEAQGAESRADFVHKMKICLKELRETRVWLFMIVKAEFIKSASKIELLIDENNQLKRKRTMHSLMRTAAIIPAAGVGARMGSNRVKQFLDFHGKPLLTVTLEKFQHCPAIHGIIWVHYFIHQANRASTSNGRTMKIPSSIN